MSRIDVRRVACFLLRARPARTLPPAGAPVRQPSCDDPMSQIMFPVKS